MKSLKWIFSALLILSISTPSQIFAQGTFGPPLQPNYSGLVGISNMALGNKGEALIAWNPNAFEVRGLYRPDSGTQFSLINFESNFGGPPVVLINDFGDMVVGWSGRNSGNVRVRFKPRGGAWEAAKILDVTGANNTIKSNRLGLSMNNNGDLLVTWKTQVGADQVVRTVYRAAGSAWPNTYETVTTPSTLAGDFYDPMAAIDEAGNQALFWTHQYADIGNSGSGGVFVLIQTLRSAGNGSWQTPTEITARGSLSGGVPCDSSVTNMVSISNPQISVDSKIGTVGISYTFYPKAFEYQTSGEFAGQCVDTSDSLTNYGFGASYGTVASGIASTQMIHQGNDYFTGNFTGQISVSNGLSSAAFITQARAENSVPSFRFGVGNPLPTGLGQLLTGYFIAARTSIGRDGTALGVTFDAGAGPPEDPEESRPPTAYVMKDGIMIHGPVSLLPSGALANTASNCRGDALIGVLTDSPDNKFYYIDYDSGNPDCNDGTPDPTPTPSSSPTPTATPDRGATLTPTPTNDIFATAKSNSVNIYIALTNFYNAIKVFKHPLDPKGAKKLKNVKSRWKALQQQFPQSVTPELIISSPWNQETFTKYYLAMKKAYRPVINAKLNMSSSEERKYKEKLRIVRGSADFLRGILAYH